MTIEEYKKTGKIFRKKYLYILTKEFFEKEYFDKKRSLYNIHKEIGINYGVIKSYFLRYGFELRTKSDTMKLVNRTLEHNKKVYESNKYRYYSEDIRKKAIDLYLNTNLSMAKVEKFFNIKSRQLRVWLRKNDFKIKPKSEVQSGEGNPNWQGGKSFEPYTSDFNDILKEYIRKRDNYICKNDECGITEEEHIIVLGKVLTVHHIDYNKKNCKVDNLITVCTQCNLRANYNKDYWKKYYTNKIGGDKHVSES